MALELASSLTPASDNDRLLQAESVVRDFCGWHIAPVRTGATYTLDAPCGRQRIYLPTLQLTALTDVDIVGSLTTFDSTAYTWDVSGWVEPSAGHLWPAHAVGARLIVTFSHGYATVPPSVTRAVQAIAQQGAANPGALRRIQAGPFIEDYGVGGGGGSVADVLAPYVLTTV